MAPRRLAKRATGRNSRCQAYADRCQPCGDKADTAALDHELYHGQSYLINTDPQELSAAGVPTVEIFTYRTEWVTKSLGRSQTVEHVDLWPLAGYSANSDGVTTTVARTVVLT
jgi:hypothetical protein